MSQTITLILNAVEDDADAGDEESDSDYASAELATLKEVGISEEER